MRFSVESDLRKTKVRAGSGKKRKTEGAERFYAFYGSGLLRAFDAANGSLVWSRQLGQYSFSSAPTVSQGVIYVGGAGSGGTVYAVSADTGSVLWTASVANGDESSPAVTSDALYVSYSCPNVYKLNQQRTSHSDLLER